MIAARAAKLPEALFRRVAIYRAVLGDHIDKHVMYVPGHVLGVTADIDSRTVFDPGENLRSIFTQPILHIDLLVLIALERDIKLIESTVLQMTLPLELVEEVFGERTITVEQPVATRRVALGALFDERAERRYAGAGSDHDN